MFKYTTMMDNADQSGEGVKIKFDITKFFLFILGTLMNTDSAGRGWIRRATNFRQFLKSYIPMLSKCVIKF